MVSAWLSVPLAVAVVIAYFAIRLALLRQRSVAPVAATPDLRDEPPAVVNLLVNRLIDAPQVASATLLDLAARRLIDIHEVADDAEHTLVRVGTPVLAGSATAYERRIVERVAATAGRTFTPVARLVEKYADGGYNWQRRLVRDAVLDARSRGLISSSDHGCALGIAAAAVAGAALLAPLLPPPGSGHLAARAVLLAPVWIVGSLICGFLLSVIGIGEKASAPDRYTAKGREATAHWLGVAAWLRRHDTMRDLPPGAVAVWDRYLAYGVALDAIPHAVRILDFETVGQRAELTSCHTGTPRTVQVRYWAQNRLLRLVGPVSARATRLWSTLTIPLWIAIGVAATTTITSPYLRGLVVVLAGVQTARAVHRLVRATLDLARPAVVTGTVLDVTVAHRKDVGDTKGPHGEALADLPTHFYVVVDDGSADVVRPWIVHRDLAHGPQDPGTPPFGDPAAFAAWYENLARPFFRTGDRVRLVGQPRSRFATAVEPITLDTGHEPSRREPVTPSVRFQRRSRRQP